MAGSTTSPAEIDHHDRPDGHPCCPAWSRPSRTPPLSTPARAPTPAPTLPQQRPAQPNRPPRDRTARRATRSRPDRQVEDHRGRNDRHRPAGHLHTAAAFLQPPHHPVGGAQPVGAAPVSTTASTCRTLLTDAEVRSPGCEDTRRGYPLPSPAPGGREQTAVPQAHPRPGSSAEPTVASGIPAVVVADENPATSVIEPNPAAERPGHRMACPSGPAPETPAAPSATGKPPDVRPSGGCGSRSAVGADVEDGAQCQLDVADCRDPGVGRRPQSVRLTAASRQGVDEPLAAAIFASRSVFMVLRSAPVRSGPSPRDLDEVGQQAAHRLSRGGCGLPVRMRVSDSRGSEGAPDWRSSSTPAPRSAQQRCLVRIER